MSDNLPDVIAEAVMKHCLGPDFRRYATAYPLSARGDLNDVDDWYETDNDSGRRRPGAPTITVHNMNSRRHEWLASVMVTPTGKNPVVYVPKGTKVVEVT